MLSEKEFSLVIDGEAWIEYNGNLYECVAFQDGKYFFQNINDLMDYIPVSKHALLHSTEFYYTDKF